MALTADQVQKFYIGYYARPADPVGLTYWQTQDEAAALKGFSESAEFTSQFTGLSASQQVTQVYNNLLGRAPDTAGLLYWAGELTAGRETIGTLVLSMTKNALGKDVTTIEDRVSYSKSFTAALDTAAEINAYAGAAATQTARTALLKVVAKSVGDHTALNAEVKNIDTTVATIVSGGSGGGTPGQTFTLTTAIGETIVGTSGNDTFKAVAQTAGATSSDFTLQTADSIDGGAGTDTLTIVAVATNAAIPASASIKNVEIINFDTTGFTFAATALKASNFAGVKELNQISNGTAAITSVVVAADGVAVGFTGNGQVGTAAADVGTAATIDFGASATAGVVNLSGVGDGSAVTLANQSATANAKLATLTVNGSVAANSATTAGTLTIDLGSSALNKVDTLKLNLTSKAIVAVGTTDAAALKTLDASGSTGGLDITATAGAGGLAKVETIKTGSAGDKLTLTLATDSLLTKVDLGAGADTLTLKGSTGAMANKALEVTLGAGADTLVLVTTGALNNVQDTADLNKLLVTVADFTKGDDTINLGGTGKVLTKTVLDNAFAAGTLAEAIAIVATDLGAATKKAAVFNHGGAAYVYVDGGSAGALDAGDSLIKLVGVDATLLSTDQNGGLVL